MDWQLRRVRLCSGGDLIRARSGAICPHERPTDFDGVLYTPCADILSTAYEILLLPVG